MSTNNDVITPMPAKPKKTRTRKLTYDQVLSGAKALSIGDRASIVKELKIGIADEAKAMATLVEDVKSL